MQIVRTDIVFGTAGHDKYRRGRLFVYTYNETTV